MKKFIFLLSLIALYACSNHPTDLERHKLIGKVKCMRVCEFHEGEKLFGEWEPVGKPDFTHEYAYNRQGLLAEYRFFKGDSLYNSEVYNNKQESSFYKGWLVNFKADNIEIITDFSGDIPVKTTATMDGEICAVFTYSDVVDCKNYTSFEYSPDGKTLLRKEIVKNGNIIELFDGTSERTAYAKYDDQNCLIESKNAVVGNFGILGVETFGPEMTTQYSYTYDATGNWTKRVGLTEYKYINPSVTILTREIEYW